MQAIDVMYLYSHADRELDVACAVKALGEAQFGLRVELAHWPRGMPRALDAYRPRVVALPFLYTEQNYFTYYPSAPLDWRRAVFVNLAWEQLLYEGSRHVKTPKGEFARAHVYHMAWGDFYADFLRGEGIPRENVFVNGNPAYTLYDPPYRRYFDRREALARRHGLDPARRWVFFPENYNWGFYTEARLQSFIREGLDPAEVAALKAYCETSFAEVMRWCQAVAEKHPVEIIVRPRPSTPMADFRAAVERAVSPLPGRLHVIKDATVREWTLASEAVVSSYSTTLIEAAVAQRAAYMLEPYPLPPALAVDWQDRLPHLRSAAEFEAACLEDGARRAGALEAWARDTVMGRGDSIWNLAERLARLARGEAAHPPFPSRASVVPPGRVPAPKWLLYEYRKALWRRKRRNATIELGPTYEKDVLDQEEIERRLEKWRGVLDGYGGAGGAPAASETACESA